MVLRCRPSSRATSDWLKPCLRRVARIYLSSEVIWQYVTDGSLVLADEKPSNYSRSPLLRGAVLHLVYESTPPNKQLQRTVIRRRGRGACVSLDHAHALRWTRAHAAAETGALGSCSHRFT